MMMMTNEPTTNTDEQPRTNGDHPVGKDECFVCHGFGHWARECTSLPATFLKENAPKCYNCHGTGHYARFCPNMLFASQGTVYFDDAGSMGSWYSPVWYPSVSQPVYFFSPPPTQIESPNGDDTHVPRSAVNKEEQRTYGPSIEIVLDQPVIDCPQQDVFGV